MNRYELTSKDDELRKEKLPEVIEVLKIGYNERGNGDIYRVFKKLGDEDALDSKYIWDIIENDDNKIISVAIYNGDETDRKISLITARADYNEITEKWEVPKENKEAFNTLLEDLKPDKSYRNVWGEFSGAMEHILVDKMKIEPVELLQAIKIMESKNHIVEASSDGIHYERDIGGHLERKVIIGNVPEKYFIETKNYETTKAVLELIKDKEQIADAFIDNQISSSVKYSLKEDTYEERNDIETIEKENNNEIEDEKEDFEVENYEYDDDDADKVE